MATRKPKHIGQLLDRLAAFTHPKRQPVGDQLTRPGTAEVFAA